MQDNDQNGDWIEPDHSIDPFEEKPVFLPIPSDQANKVVEKYFDPGFRARHALEEPFWVGDVATEILGLDSALTYDAFHNLLNGRTPDGESELGTTREATQICAWHRLCTAPGSVGVLRALGAPRIQELITKAHNDAVQNELRQAEQQVGGHDFLEPDEYLSRFLFACFPGLASHEQSPQLHTRVVWINTAFLYSGTTRRVASDQISVMESIQDDYETNLHWNLKSNLSRFRLLDYGADPYEIAGVPLELYREHSWMFADRTGPLPPVLCANGKASTREELLECWRQQAKTFGWGAREAAALISSVMRERVCLEAQRTGGSYSAKLYREGRIKAMTDHLLWQQQARFHAKKGVKPWQAGRVIKQGRQ